jgi:hypothetical protein
MTYLREWLRQKLEDHGDGDVFLEDGDNRIIWLSPDDSGGSPEILVITIQPGTVEVAR